MVHQLVVEVLVQMRDLAQIFCTIGKMEEVEGTMLMWPLPSCRLSYRHRREVESAFAGRREIRRCENEWGQEGGRLHLLLTHFPSHLSIHGHPPCSDPPRCSPWVPFAAPTPFRAPSTPAMSSSQ